MNAGPQRAAFSLVEVVIAVGVFAVGVGTILLLLPNLTRQTAESCDFLVSQQLPEALRIEFKRVAHAQGFDQLANSFPQLATPLVGGRQFVADRDGVRLHAVDLPPSSGGLQPAEQYFLVECWSFPAEPLAPSPSKGFLATFVRVSWPYRVKSGGSFSTVPLENRTEFTFSCGLNP